jgi:Cu2+-exporting ATPase
MLERAKADRPPVALLADRIASRFVVGVLLLASTAAVAWYYLDPSRAFAVALATLVVTCPCALALATPAAIAAATARLSRAGFLVVRARVLEVLNHATVIVFDKTGTLTEGCPVILKTAVLHPHDSDAERLLALAAAIETASEHVLARAFTPFYLPARFAPHEVLVVPGAGVEASIADTRYRIGAAEFVAALSGDESQFTGDTDRTAVFLGDTRRVLARFDVGDELRADARAAIDTLKASGFRLVIASGDREAAVRRIAESLDIEDWHAGLSPSSKLDLIRELRAQGETVVMVGDGINDAPVLAAADASIALDAGTALARASADAVSLGRKLGSIVTAMNIAERTQRIIRQNIAWAIVYNLTAVPLAVSGLLAPWMAAIGMSASSLIVVLNALRLHREPTAALEGNSDAPAVEREAVT